MEQQRQMSPVLDRKDGLIALGLGLLSMALYVRTLVPGLLPGDGGEFQTLAYTLGHAHTTGYEVYALLAKLFTLLVPVRDIAYRVNAFSAFCGGLIVAFVYLAGKVLSRRRLAGAVGAFSLGIAATFWSQSIIAEVYTAGGVFTSAILLLVLIWSETGSLRSLFAAGLLGGLAINAHGSNSLFAPAVGALLLLSWKDLRKAWKPALGGAALGLAVMLVCFLVVDLQKTYSSSIQSIYQPSATRWDVQPKELDSISGRFAYLAFARQWRSAMFADSPEVAGENINTFNRFFANDFALPLRLLMALGLLALFARRWRLGIFFVLAITVHTIYTLNYRIGDIYVFYISLYIYLCVLLAEGTAAFLRLLDRLPGFAPKILQPALALIIVVAAVLPVYPQRLAALKAGVMRFDFMNLPSNEELDLSRNAIRYNVKDLDQNAVVLADWDNLYRYLYVAEVEQGRNDLRFIEAYPYSTKEGMADSLLVFITDQLEQGHPVYSLHPLDEVRRGGLTFRMKSVGVMDMYSITKQ